MHFPDRSTLKGNSVAKVRKLNDEVLENNMLKSCMPNNC